MHSSFDLRNAIVTQKSKNQVLIFDSIQQGIDKTISDLKKEHKNASVRNFAYYIHDQLVIAQLFINRLNGFVPTEESKFGTTPTAYRIQLRFVHGFAASLGNEHVFISNGAFTMDNLAPRQIQDYVIDDVHHDMQLINGSGISIQQTKQTVTLNVPGLDPMTLTTSLQKGKGHTTPDSIVKTEYYFNPIDYEQRYKLNAVYAICYLQPEHNAACRIHEEYRGFIQAQQGTYEPRDAQASVRYNAYQEWTKQLSDILRTHPLSSRWIANHQRSASEGRAYTLDILSVNGMQLHMESGLMVDRLYDYQVELMQLITHVYQKIRSNSSPQLPSTVHASIVDMGVGAGKTYITNGVLKFLSRYYRDPYYAPAFCMTPDAALAHVMVRVVNKHDGLAQIRSYAMTSAADSPDAAFLERYQAYTQIAVQDISEIRQYLNQGLQYSILDYCRSSGLHPFVIINALYDKPGECATYQNSIDIKRLLLLIEGQKLITQKTGLSPLVALRRLYDELEKIIIAVDKERTTAGSLFYNIDAKISSLSGANLRYDQDVELPRSLRTSTLTHINLKHMTANILHRLLLQKFSYKRDVLQQSVSIRDVLLKIACLSDVSAAILLANGGGLANTHTLKELTSQINDLLEPAARELRRGAEHQRAMSALEERGYYLYLNELFSTIPDAINSKPYQKEESDSMPTWGGFHRRSWEPEPPKYKPKSSLLETSLRHNYQLLQQLRRQIGQKLEQLSRPQPMDQHWGPTVIETVDHMAGQVGLLLSGTTTRDAAKLLSTHVPVFTPEGFVAYLEHLVAREGQADITIQYQEGVYLARASAQPIKRAAIQQRLVQLFSAVMLADEIHKEAYQFLYDPQHPLYVRVNRITLTYLNHEFGAILPHRIGMSGTVNHIARSGFGHHTLYELPLQDMIQRQITKEIKVTHFNGSQELQADYFQGNDGWQVSKGIVFSKQATNYPNMNLDHGNRELPHLNALRNQLIVHYLEFVLQKSGASKELSEIVGLQNKLHSKGVSLLTAFLAPQQYGEELQDIIRSLRNVSPDLITETDVQQYVQFALHDPKLQTVLRNYILLYKTDYVRMVRALGVLNIPLKDFFTHDLEDFEDGLSQVLIGTEAQQTGYSHEFVGVIVDASSRAMTRPFIAMSSDPVGYYEYLQDLLKHSFSYDEKNQIGGRALRTASGTASYIEYLSPNYQPNAMFNIETSFDDIFIQHRNMATLRRASVLCNRMILGVLNEFDGSFEQFVDAVIAHCQTQSLLNDYQQRLEQHLPGWWALKYQLQLISSQDLTPLQHIVREKLSQISNEQVDTRHPPVQNDGWTTRPIALHIAQGVGIDAALWLAWMTHSSLMVVGAVVILAGLGLLSATSMGLIAGALIVNGAKGLIVAGSLLCIPGLSKIGYTFFQRDHRASPEIDTALPMQNERVPSP